MENKDIYGCPIENTMDLIAGKWKLIILWHLAKDEILRYSEIKKVVPSITHKMLSQQLKELEAAGFINRKVYPTIPPKVEYSLTDLGKSFLPILNSLSEWGEVYINSKRS